MDNALETAAELLREAGLDVKRAWGISSGIDDVSGYQDVLYVAPDQKVCTARVRPNPNGLRPAIETWTGWVDKPEGDPPVVSETTDDAPTHNCD